MKERIGNILSVDGDILAMPDDFDGVEEHRQRLAEDVDADLRGLAMRTAGQRKKKLTEGVSTTSSETDVKQSPVMEVIEDAARHEHYLRSKGAAALRIESQVYRPMNIKLAKLARVHDTSIAYPDMVNYETSKPEAAIDLEAYVVEGANVRSEEVQLTEAQSRHLDALMDGTGMSYGEALKHVL